MKNRWVLCFLFVVALILSRTISQAAPVTVTFTGEITSIWGSSHITLEDFSIGQQITTIWVLDIDQDGYTYNIGDGTMAPTPDSFYANLISPLLLGGRSDYLTGGGSYNYSYHYATNETTSNQLTPLRFEALGGLYYDIATIVYPGGHYPNWTVGQTTFQYHETLVDSAGGEIGITAGVMTLVSMTGGTPTPIPSSAFLLITGIIGILSRRRLS